MTIYYNEFDRGAAAWLRELIGVGELPDGTVDLRDIHDVQSGECGAVSHFFAGIGGWPLALRLAGWPDDQPVWTGSCPCQPFSNAGKRQGVHDPRHLWPEFRRLIRDCCPPVIFGEQVASKDGRLWLAGVRTDLEALGYAVGAADLCAAGVGAPHIRQRLFWVAYAAGRGFTGANRTIQPIPRSGAKGRLGGLGHAGGAGLSSPQCSQLSGAVCLQEGRAVEQPGGALHPAWGSYYLLPMLDGKTRRVESRSFPLADGFPGRVELLRGYGNAIVPQVAAEFIRAAVEAMT